MDKRPAAERVRPILAAMERSVDAARQRRLHSDDDGEKPVTRERLKTRLREVVAQRRPAAENDASDCPV